MKQTKNVFSFVTGIEKRDFKRWLLITSIIACFSSYTFLFAMDPFLLLDGNTFLVSIQENSFLQVKQSVLRKKLVSYLEKYKEEWGNYPKNTKELLKTSWITKREYHLFGSVFEYKFLSKRAYSLLSIHSFYPKAPKNKR